MGKKRPRVFRSQRSTFCDLFAAGVSVDEAAATMGQPLAAVRSMFRMIAAEKGLVMAEDSDERELQTYLLRLPKELHDWYKVEARQSGRSIRWLMVNAMEQYQRRIEAGRQK